MAYKNITVTTTGGHTAWPTAVGAPDSVLAVYYDALDPNGANSWVNINSGVAGLGSIIDYKMFDSGAIPLDAVISQVTIVASTVDVAGTFSGTYGGFTNGGYYLVPRATIDGTPYPAPWTFTTDPVTGLAWTRASLFSRSFGVDAYGLNPDFRSTAVDGTPAGLNLVSFYLTVTYSVPPPAETKYWWSLAGALFAGLKFRFNLTFNCFRYAAANPGTTVSNGGGGGGSGADSQSWAKYLDGATPPAPYGWFQSTDGMTGAAAIVTGGVPANPRSFEEINSFATAAAALCGGSPGAGVVFDNLLVYPAKTYTVGTDLPPIRVFDGVSDRELVRLPKTPAGVVPKAVLSMFVANGTIYLTTLDGGTSSTTWAGRVFALDPTTAILTSVGDDAFSGGQLPYALGWHAGQLWVGTHRQDLTAVGAIYRLRTDATTPTWVKDHDLTAGQGSVTGLYSFRGTLFVATTAAAGTFAKILARATDGTYSTSDTGAGGTATDGNAFFSFQEFNGNLYAGYWNGDATPVAMVRKFNGASWSTAYTGSALTARPYLVLFVENSLLYVYGAGLQATAALLSSVDGASWVDLSPELTGTSQGLPIVGVVVL